MNILYISADRGIPIRGNKGASVHVRAISNAFARAGHNVSIMTPRPGPEDGPAPDAAIIHIPLPPLNESLPEKLARERQTQAYAEPLYQAAREQMARESYDFIYERYSLWSDVGARLSRATRLPLVLEVNAPLRQEADSYRQLHDADLAARIEETQFKRAFAVAVVSEQLQDYVIRCGVAPHRVHVLPNGVNPIKFHPAVSGMAVRQQYRLEERTIIGFVGRPRPWHDLGILIRAVSRLHRLDPCYHLLLVGQMPADIQIQLSQVGLEHATTITGPVPHNQVPQHIAAMDVAVSTHLPLEDFYFSPLKLYEYMVCGTPTVAANLGQPAHFVQRNKIGLLYEPGKTHSLVKQIKKLVDEPLLARKMAWEGATAVLKKYTWDDNAQTVINWLIPATTMRIETRSPTLPLLDNKLRLCLYQATRPDLVGPLLAHHLPALEAAQTGRLDINVFKYKPRRRCVLGYTISDQQQVIGKVFRDDRGLRLHHWQKQLWQNGFGDNASDGIHVPRSLAYVPEMQMQVQEMVPGETLNRLAARGNINHLVSLAAAGLAKLHNFTVPSVNGDSSLAMRTYFLGDELNNLHSFKENLMEVRPDLTVEVEELYAALTTWAADLPDLQIPTPVHRDFYYSQILIDGHRLTLIDLDLFALGDPAIDVANFTAHLYLLGLRLFEDIDFFAPGADLFLSAYARLRPVDAAFWQRFLFYEAATYFRLIKVAAPRPSWQHFMKTLCQKTAVSLKRV